MHDDMALEQIARFIIEKGLTFPKFAFLTKLEDKSPQSKVMRSLVEHSLCDVN